MIGDKIGIKSFWVLFAILLFGGLWGLAGMILAVPLFACIYELSKNLLQKKEEKNNKKQELEKLNNQKKKLVV